jgi:hypothetical protein
MDLSKLPPFVAMSLGLLGCVAEPCLSFSPETETETSTGTGTGTGTTEVGPCHSPPLDTSGTTDVSETFTTSACLSPPEPETDTDPSTGTDTGTGSGSDSGTSSGSDSGTSSGSDSGSDSGTSGMMADEPLPPTRAAAVERMRSRGTLPADVLDRLRALTSSTKR